MHKIDHKTGVSGQLHLPVGTVIHLLLTAWSALRSALLSVIAALLLPLYGNHSDKAVYCIPSSPSNESNTDATPVPRTLLPAPASRKLTVVLDLDETLVCTYPSDRVPTWLQASSPQRYPMRRIQYGRSGHPSNTIVVYERPGLQTFLSQASRFAELVIFTAGHAAYAQPVVDLLDPERRFFAGALFRDATVTASSRENVKDLSLLGRDLSRTVLVDNNPYSFLMQPANGLPIAPYHGDADDGHLLGVVLPLLEALAQLHDVRHVLGPKFQMAAWFRSKGLQVPDPPLHRNC